MPRFGTTSLARLKTCNTDIQDILVAAIKLYDFSIIQGARDIEQQKANVKSGASKTLKSKHVVGNPDDPRTQKGLSDAVDIAPYPIRYPKSGSKFYTKDVARFYYLAGILKGIVASCNEWLKDQGVTTRVSFRYGGDWDGDDDFNDQTFDDIGHFEIYLVK